MKKKLKPPKIKRGYVANFDTLKRGAANDDLALMSCIERATQKPAVLVCCVAVEMNGEYTFTPMARMLDGNPYEDFQPPMDEGDALDIPQTDR